MCTFMLKTLHLVPSYSAFILHWCCKIKNKLNLCYITLQHITGLFKN